MNYFKKWSFDEYSDEMIRDIQEAKANVVALIRLELYGSENDGPVDKAIMNLINQLNADELAHALAALLIFFGTVVRDGDLGIDWAGTLAGYLTGSTDGS